VTSCQVRVPSQRFSRSQGLDPPGTYRPCFMPVPPLGFFFYPSRPISTRRAASPLGLPCPLEVRHGRLRTSATHRSSNLGDCWNDEPFSLRLGRSRRHFRAWFPASVLAAATEVSPVRSSDLPGLLPP
jgi:hypothetical protein